jgi:hypothetical protein
VNPEYAEAIASIQAVKLAVAIAGTGLWLWGAVLNRVGRSDRQRRLRDALLLTLGLLSVLCWTNFFRFHYSHYLHGTDFFHYYMGARYFPELGYTGLYDCTSAADVAAGLGDQVAARSMRNLETNAIESGKAIVADLARCTRRFSPERWLEFQTDVAWFRQLIPDSYWQKIQLDHGYNATPAWAILGSTLASFGETTPARIFALTLLDWLLLVAMWGVVWRAFGWRVMCAALIFWGTNYPAHFGWTGGSYLRQDWLAALVIGICCIRMDRPLAGGFALACATLLRIYPGFVVLALALKAALEMLRRRRFWLSRSHGRIAIGGLLATASIFAMSEFAAGGSSAWREFAVNTRRHLATPSANRTGLVTLISYDAKTRASRAIEPSKVDPFAAWREARVDTFERRRLLYWSLVLGYTGLLVYAMRAQKDWVCAVLGIGLIPIVAEPSSYYLAALLGFGLLASLRGSFGAGICGLAALTLLTPKIWQDVDVAFVGISGEVVVFIVLATAFIARQNGSGAPTDKAGPDVSASTGGSFRS